MKPEHIIIHHTAVSREKNAAQFDAVNRYHQSLGWGNIGYHFLIEPNGKVCAGRRTDEVGAHCKEQSMNYHSIGICLTGNFDIEKPTPPQIFALRDLLRRLCKEFNIRDCRIWFHTDFAHYKTCPGKNMDRGFVRSLLVRG